MTLLHLRATLFKNSRWSDSAPEFILLSHNQWQWWINNSKLYFYVTFLEILERQEGTAKLS